MLETGRRTAISTSELGLYSDRVDRYNRNRYNPVVRKFTIGVMVVVAVILVAIFLYDFTSATSASSKVSQETKHIYILQNALKKSSNTSKRTVVSTAVPEVNGTDDSYMQDRSYDEDYGGPPRDRQEAEDILTDTRLQKLEEPELRAQNLNNFKLRKRVLKSIENNVDTEPAESKQLFDNHAVVYRVRQRYKHPDSDEDSSSEEVRPTPFHWEYKTPHPTSFKRTKYPQLSQYRYPHSSRNIQDIIKYLTNDSEMPNRGIKFTGVYVNPKKYDLLPDIGEMMSNSDRSEEESPPYPIVLNDDPFYQYKPKHPADVNLLATSNVRFSPTGLHRYNPYYDSLYTRPVINYNKQPSSMESQFENAVSYPGTSTLKRRKPKPFSVMLDIYPITDIADQNKKASRPRPQIATEDYEPRRPGIQFNRGPKFYVPPPQPIPLLNMPSQQTLTDEEERQQMIFHLNLYPRKKNKLSRHDIIHRSESMAPEEREQFAEKIMSPLETIAKHLAVEQLKFDRDDKLEATSLPITRYQETILDNGDEDDVSTQQEGDFADTSRGDDLGETSIVPSNHKSVLDEDYASTEKYETEAQKIVETTTVSKQEDHNTTALTVEQPKNNKTESIEVSKDIDTVEGFQRFSDGLLTKN